MFFLSCVCARYLTAAATFEGARGEGRRGWLHLLAAYALAPHDEWIVEQVLYDRREWSCNMHPFEPDEGIN